VDGKIILDTALYDYPDKFKNVHVMFLHFHKSTLAKDGGFVIDYANNRIVTKNSLK